MDRLKQTEAIQDAGRKAGIASRNRDSAGARWHCDWARRAIALDADPEGARRAFQAAYRSAINVNHYGR